MSSELDKEIARLERELSQLKRKKYAELQSQLAKLAADLDDTSGGGDSSAPAAGGRGARKAAKKRGRKPGRKAGGRRGGRKPQVSDEEALELLRKHVAAAGPEGVSARAASDATGILYPRAIQLMQANFKKRGSGKWTRYTA